MKVMKSPTRFKIDTSRPRMEDPYYPAACENVKEAFRKLREAGIVDAEGRRIRKDLPPDMQEGKERDFGG